MGGLSFKSLSRERFKEKRNIVISEVYNKYNEEEGKVLGYAVKEQFVVEEKGKQTGIYLKGGLGILDRKGLARLKLAVDKACEKAGINTEELEDATYEETKEEDF